MEDGGRVVMRAFSASTVRRAFLSVTSTRDMFRQKRDATMMWRTVSLTAVAVVSTLTLASCGGGDTAAPAKSPSETSSSAEAAPTKDFSELDVTFAQTMVPHHAQAVEMSDLVLAKQGVDDDVRGLAEQIKAAQAPEIEHMMGWLEDWDADMPSMGGMDADEMEGMEGKDHAGSGMMSAEDMTALEGASGADASRLFLEQMTAHHQGAIDSARAQVEEGTNPEATALAQEVIDSQEREIDQMAALLAGL